MNIGGNDTNRPIRPGTCQPGGYLFRLGLVHSELMAAKPGSGLPCHNKHNHLRWLPWGESSIHAVNVHPDHDPEAMARVVLIKAPFMLHDDALMAP